MSREVSNIIVAAIVGASVVAAAYLTARATRYERVVHETTGPQIYRTLDKWTGDYVHSATRDEAD